jgi:hypothetical protein
VKVGIAVVGLLLLLRLLARRNGQNKGSFWRRYIPGRGPVAAVAITVAWLAAMGWVLFLV